MGAGGQEVLLEAGHVGVDVGHGQAQAVEPGLHGVEAVDPRRVERAAQQAAAAGGVGHLAGGGARQAGEAGEPAGVDGPFGVARRAVGEAGALPGHGVLVATRQVEGATLDGGEVGRHGHEAVVAVDHDQGLGLRDGGHQPGEVGNDVAGVEEHVRPVDEVVAAPAGGGGEALGERGERFGRHPLDGGQPVLLQAGGLAGEAVELGVGGEDPDRRRQRGQEPDHEGVGARGEGDGLRVGQAEARTDVTGGLGEDGAEDLVPLVVDQAGGIEPGLLLGFEGDVGPGVVAVGGHVEPARHRIEEPAEVGGVGAHEPAPAADGAPKRNPICASTSAGSGGRAERGMKYVGRSKRSLKTRWRRAAAARYS